MRTSVVSAIAGLWLLGSTGGAEAQVRSGFFEEAGRLVDQVASQLQALGVHVGETWGPGHGGFGGPMASRGSTSPAERPLISMMLHHRDELGLTDEQVARLEGLRSEFTREAIRREADIRVAELDLATLLRQDPLDLAKAEAKIREVAQLGAEHRIARLRTLEQGKAVLTPEQRGKLAGLLEGPPHRRGALRRSESGTRL